MSENEQMVNAFYAYCKREEVVEPRREGVKYHCPCCGYKTLDERGGYDICPICFWEDDGQDDKDADQRSPFSPNHMSLTEGRSNFKKCGASDERRKKSVREPTSEEQADKISIA